jgi:hypothetical protein
MQNNELLPHSTSLTLMYEILRFTKRRLADPSLMAQLSQRIKENQLPVQSEMFALAQTEIIKACELMIPGLMMDFLLENSALVDREAAAEWAKKKDDAAGVG